MTQLVKSNTWGLYDPDWEQKYDLHFALADKELSLPPEQRNQELIDFHMAQWKKAWISQFKNAPQYAARILEPLKQKAKAGQLVWVQEDLSKLETVEDVQNLYEQTDASLQAQEKDSKGSLPTDKSGTSFAEDNTHSTNARVQHNGGSFLGQPSYTDTALTLEEIDGQLNVCLSHLKDFGTTSVYNAIELIASNLYNNGFKNKYPDPSKINWYIHSSASNHAGKENFCKVDMKFSNGQFSNPEFEHLPEVPKAVKMAVWNAAQDEIALTLDQPESHLLLGNSSIVPVVTPKVK
jgi:hypothetical protein